MTTYHAEVLALLEEGPASAAVLAQWLQRSRLAVSQDLRQLAEAGLVKKVGTAKWWALTTFTPKPGRKPVLDREAICARVLASIPLGALVTTGDLRRAVGASRQAVLQACTTLVALGELARVDEGRPPRWTRPRDAAPTGPATARPVGAVRRPPDRSAVVTERGVSFWVGCDRQELARRIAARQEEMRHSRAAKLVDGSVREY